MPAETIPKELKRVLDSVSADCHAKVTELHKLFSFGMDDLEAFQFNAGGNLNLENLIAFRTFLEAEKALKAPKKAATPARGGSRNSSGTGVKRNLAAATAAAVTSVLTSGPESQEKVTTPASKKAREAETNIVEPARGTPEKTVALKVSLKTSVNAGKLEKPKVQQTASIKLLGNSDLWTGSRHGGYTWMDEALPERAARRDERLQAMEPSLLAAVQARRPGEAVAVGTVGVPSQAEVVLCGRIVCEGLEGRLNERSMLLEGTKASSNAARVQLNVAECPRVVAFPGQMVGVVGRSGMAGTTFHAKDFVAGLPIVPKEIPQSSLHMMVLSGPFCTRDGLDYSPLESALEHALKERPQVLVLLGPFLDSNNSKVASGEPSLPGSEETCCYEEIYAHHIFPLLKRRLAPLRTGATPTEVLLVPSLDEVLCFHPLPQPPLDAALGGSPVAQLKQMGVQFLPNPAHVEINGVKVSLTSADSLTPVLREIVVRPNGNKIEEALRLLLQQRNLFPVVPRDPVQVCESRAVALEFPDGDVPDVCVFPSMSGTANGTVVENTVFVNPGSLSRPAALGSFAELFLAAPPSGAAKTPLKERVRVDIHKLDAQ